MNQSFMKIKRFYIQYRRIEMTAKNVSTRVYIGTIKFNIINLIYEKEKKLKNKQFLFKFKINFKSNI